MPETLVEFVPEPQKKVDTRDVMEILDDSLNKVVRFVNRDIDATIDYIEANNIPVHFITGGKRIDLHPAREYLLRVPKTMREVVVLKKLMNDEDDDLDTFWADNK